MDCIDIGGKPSKSLFIFGYGSLIEDESRERTTPTARDSWPVRVQGIRRGWWARGASSGLTTTYLGALDDPKAVCNGVIYAVTEEELAATDRRESAGYRRCRIPTKSLTMLDGRDKPPKGEVWAYVNDFPKSELKGNLPSPQFPMVQSYVDICVHGALEVEARYPTASGFVQEFIATTDAWSKHWVNDRIYPRRPFIFRPSASRIDQALRQAPATRELVWEVEIEPASWEDRKPVRPPKMAKLTPAAAGPACWEVGG